MNSLNSNMWFNYKNPIIVTIILLMVCNLNVFGRTSKTLIVTLPNDGKLVGRFMRSSNGNGIRAFIGIPYAEPPVGNLRFRVS